MKGCIFMLIGAFLCTHYAPTPKPEVQQVSQVQTSKCKVVTTKRQNGDEITEFLAENSQKQEIKVNEKNHSIGIIPKYNFNNNSSDVAGFYSYKGLGVYLSKSEIGLVFSKSF